MSMTHAKATTQAKATTKAKAKTSEHMAEDIDAEAAYPESKATDREDADAMLNEYSKCARYRQSQYWPGCIWDHCCAKCKSGDGSSLT